MEGDGTVDTYNTTESVSTFLAAVASVAGTVPPDSDKVLALYPGLSDAQVIADIERDLSTRWCVPFWFNMKENDK